MHFFLCSYPGVLKDLWVGDAKKPRFYQKHFGPVKRGEMDGKRGQHVVKRVLAKSGLFCFGKRTFWRLADMGGWLRRDDSLRESVQDRKGDAFSAWQKPCPSGCCCVGAWGPFGLVREWSEGCYARALILVQTR